MDTTSQPEPRMTIIEANRQLRSTAVACAGVMDTVIRRLGSDADGIAVALLEGVRDNLRQGVRACNNALDGQALPDLDMRHRESRA